MLRARTALITIALAAVAFGCEQPQDGESPAATADQEAPTVAEEQPTDEAGAEPAAENEAGAEATGGKTISALGTADDEKLGTYLTDREGRAVYLFESDKGKDDSTCYGACAEMWPPVLAEGKPEVGDKLDASLVGTLDREGGATQVTYADWPLYYYKPDESPGQTKGQDIEGFGAEWYLLTPAGEKVHAEGEEEGHDG